ncbi:1081_t:CDS:2 [Ambispora gerdemannii]|uniref:1081_t:CDS:1 n=1 Tax=Ambispora gerdemannii TaxID=144530 RepID=A0A9N9A4T8_9GLOM|nr:1081_t:CDS:2 [Ambispora gerdemannii]
MAEVLEINFEKRRLLGELHLPSKPDMEICVFVYGSGSLRYLAQVLRSQGVGTYLLNLLTSDEKEIDSLTKQLQYDWYHTSNRVVAVIDHFAKDERAAKMPIGLFV